MLFTRKIGKFLRGKTTPWQILSASILGGLIGSFPGFTQGPLLLLLLLFLLLILNANLFVGGLVLLGSKILVLLLLPLLFRIGVFLLEGPLGNVIAPLVNAPVTAWFGLEYYVMLPSLLLGLLFGLLAGGFLLKALNGFRERMGRLEEGSEKYNAYVAKRWVRALAWIFFGGIKGKKSWEELRRKKVGLPVRPLGIVFVIGLSVLLYVGLQLLDTRIVTSVLRERLEQLNGATVDLASLEIHPADGRAVVSGLALADPANLDSNRFSSERIVANISGLNLLAKKLVLDEVIVEEANTGTERRVRGRIVEKPPEKKEEEPEEPQAEEEAKPLEEYLGEATVWKERLDTIKRLYDKVAPHLKKEDEEEGEPAPEEKGWFGKLQERAKESGYAAVTADGLVRSSPRLWVRQLSVDNLKVGGSEQRFAVKGTDLATQPLLLEERGNVELSRADGDFELRLLLPGAGEPTRSGLSLRMENLAVADLEKAAGRTLPLQGGTVDFTGEGEIDAGALDLPLSVVLRDTTLNAFGQELEVKELPLDVKLSGPLDRPRLDLPEDALKAAVQEGGKQQLKKMIDEKAGDKLKELLPFGG